MALVRKSSTHDLAARVNAGLVPLDLISNLPPGVLAGMPPEVLATLPEEGRRRAAIAGAEVDTGGPTGYPIVDRVHLPSHFLPMKGTGPDDAYELISSDLLLDGSARLNLATFVTTSMPPMAARLMAETADKNMIDKDEYPQTAEIEARCVSMIANLWNSPHSEGATGCSTTGSSEAVMLAALALKWRWRARRQAAGKPTDRPNLVTGANVQVCWEKFCRYFDVEGVWSPSRAAGSI